MYIVDYTNNRIQKWYPGASYGTTAAAGTLSLPVGMRIDPLGNLAVADTSNHRIVSFGVICRMSHIPSCFSINLKFLVIEIASPTTTTAVPPSENFPFFLKNRIVNIATSIT